LRIDLIAAKTGSLPSAEITSSFMSIEVGVSAATGIENNPAIIKMARTQRLRCAAKLHLGRARGDMAERVPCA
jgi:hypothetical protein